MSYLSVQLLMPVLTLHKWYVHGLCLVGLHGLASQRWFHSKFQLSFWQGLQIHCGFNQHGIDGVLSYFAKHEIGHQQHMTETSRMLKMLKMSYFVGSATNAYLTVVLTWKHAPNVNLNLNALIHVAKLFLMGKHMVIISKAEWTLWNPSCPATLLSRTTSLHWWTLGRIQRQWWLWSCGHFELVSNGRWNISLMVHHRRWWWQ